jgi:hypothetical protein
MLLRSSVVKIKQIFMKYQSMRNLLEEHFINFDGAKKYRHQSVINKGFPGQFNISFSEPETLKEFGSLINIKNKLIFVRIQPCIRFDDFVEIIVPLSKNSSFYLSVFDMGGICLCYPEAKKIKERIEKLIKSSWDFLINKLVLNPKYLYIKCFSGGNIIQITKGKYKINKDIKQDSLSINQWLNLGLSKENIIFDNSRDTLLTLSTFRPTPWGYRTEILYKFKNCELIDIGTIEYLLWSPIFKKEKIIDIEKWKNSLFLAVFGLERLNLVVNNYQYIEDCDQINPLFKKILSDSKRKNKLKTLLLSQCIRATQRIMTDSKGYFNLSRHRKKKFSKYIQTMYQCLNNSKILPQKINIYLKINAKLQPWYPELYQNYKLVYQEIMDAFLRRKYKFNY